MREAQLAVTLSPGPLDVVKAQEPVGTVHDHADRVEADRVGLGTRVGVLVEPGARKALQACALAELQPRQRLVLRAQAPAPIARASRLYLDEHERSAVERDQVDLAMAGPRVALHRHEPETPEVDDREILAERAQRAPPVAPGRHAGWRCAVCGHSPTVGQKM